MATDTTEVQPHRPQAKAKRRSISQERIVFAVAIVVAIVAALGLPTFRTTHNALILLENISVLGILGVGMAIVVIARGIDISQVAIMAVTGAMTVGLLNQGMGQLPALLLGLLLALGLGVFNGFVIAYVEIPALFATLATMLLYYNGGQVFFKVNTQYLPERASFLLTIGQGEFLGIPIPIYLFVLVAVVAQLVLTRTVFGRFVYAHGDNPEAAALTGIPTRPWTVLEYVVSAVIGYLGGLLYTGQAASMDTEIVNGTLIFQVILIVVLGGVSLVGGRGSAISAVVGAVLIGVVTNAMTLENMSNELQSIVLGVILLGAIILDNRLHPRDEETVRQGE